MDIFGLTPVDTALSVWGLNCSQGLINFIFVQTSLGVLAFVIGFILSLWQSAREANFKGLVLFVFIGLAVFFLIIVPQHKIASFKSASEAYGDHPAAVQSLKSTATDTSLAPVIVSFLGQIGDSLVIGAISAVDSLLPEDLRFLSNPFKLQTVSLQANQSLYHPFEDLSLSKELSDFIYSDYWPSLNLYLNNHHPNNLLDLWPGDSRIVDYYSSAGQKDWTHLQGRLLDFISESDSPWGGIKNYLKQLNLNTNKVEDQIMASLVRAQMQIQSKPWWCGPVEALQTFFSYSYGAANFLLYISFPFLILAIIIFRRLNMLLHYMEIFVWVKSWILTAAISHYISLLSIHVQAQGQSGIHWFWENPYHSLLFSVFLYGLPLITFLGVNRSFQLIHHQIRREHA